MPSKNLRFYNFELCRLIIGGVIVGGYDDEGGVEYEPANDINEMTVGADGEATNSHITNDMVVATITLKETSKSYRDLMELAQEQWRTQRTPGGGAGAVSYTHFDPSTGDEIRERQAIFLNRPGQNKTRTAGSREIRMALPYALRNTKFASLILNAT